MGISNLLNQIGRICPWDILKQARIRKFGEDYGRIVAIDEPFYVQVKTLDRQIPLPYDTGTSGFENITRDICAELAPDIWRSLTTVTTSNKTNISASVEVELTGSFSQGTKVDDMDEFDYLGIVKIDEQWLQSQNLTPDSLPEFLRKHNGVKSTKYVKITMIIQYT